MTARTKGHRTRAQLRLVAPRSVSRNITPARGGAAVHYEGPSIGITASADHAKCEETWRANQRYHMGTNGWVDVAYTGAFCQHGYALAGRGFGVRTAANGTNAGNQSFYAFTWIGGGSDIPTPEALDCLEWWVREAREHGAAGDMVVPHKGFFSTSCPGGVLTDRAQRLNNSHITAGNTTPLPPQKVPARHRYTAQDCRDMQKLVGVTVDGRWGKGTDHNAASVRAAAMAGKFNVREVQGIIGTVVDGDWGKASAAALRQRVRQIQILLAVRQSGTWDSTTAVVFTVIRAQFYNKF